jgi:HD-GYP domain-containing protein (c-di-GMP phosphodiesterase class II)
MVKQIKLSVDEIQLGMYVSQLDRPWVETPFVFQGFYVSSPQDIQMLRNYCQYVYVDETLSRLAVTGKRYPLVLPRRTPANAVTPSLIDTPKDLGTFRDQLRVALHVHENTKKFINQAMLDVRLGKNIDVQEARKLVSQLAENVVTNPTALLWLTQLKNKDEYTSLHSLNVCVLSLFFGRSMQLDSEKLHTLGLGALLHDVGKLLVPSEVLNKPGRLTPAEYGVMQQHTVFGYDLMKNRGELSPEALNIVIQHHERLDGSGYPNRLDDNKISLFSKLVSIVDVYDAVTSKRVYHDETTPYKALNDIYQHRDKDFDPQLVQQFIKCLGIYPIGSLVELTTGQVGVVAFFSEKNHLSPTVMLILDGHKKPYDKYRYVNLGSKVWDKHAGKPEIKRIADPNEFGIDLSSVISNESLHLAIGR